MSEAWYTVRQVSELLQVNVVTVQRWIRAGALPATYLGSTKAGYRVSQSDLDAFMHARRGEQGKREAA